MITLDVKDYCEECLDFRADVTHPERMVSANGTVVQSDTIIRCANAGRCEGIKRYLERKMKGDKE